jgi:branched-chain amino acid transport system ATP-binding protein
VKNNQPLLKVEGLTKSFMGLKAVDDLSFQVNPGQVVSIIGPNGAGKTTVFNLISKLYEFDMGTSFLESTNLTKLKSHEVNNAGLARTYQNIRLLNELSLLDNVMVSLGTRLNYTILDVILNRKTFRQSEEDRLEVATKLLKRVGLYNQRNEKASSLSYGEQRRLEIVRALATNPKLLLMDEPAAGMTGAEKIELSQLIKSIVSEGVSVLLIEHDMRFVMDICDHIIVLNYGKKIAEGKPEEIKKNEQVIEAYLGKSHAAS